MKEFPFQIKSSQLLHQRRLWITNKWSHRWLEWMGFGLSLSFIIVFIYRPLSNQVSELEKRQTDMKERLSYYESFMPSEEIPTSEMLPGILDQYFSKLKHESIEIRSFNVEKFVSTAIPQTTLGYALVRVHLHLPNFQEALKQLEEVEGHRIILEQIRFTPSETSILIKVYFNSQ